MLRDICVVPALHRFSVETRVIFFSIPHIPGMVYRLTGALRISHWMGNCTWDASDPGASDARPPIPSDNTCMHEGKQGSANPRMRIRNTRSADLLACEVKLGGPGGGLRSGDLHNKHIPKLDSRVPRVLFELAASSLQ